MSEAQTFNFELVSPERKLLSEPAEKVIIPGEEGDFGVLAGHSSLVASIRPGVVEVYKTSNGTPERIFIAGGFADVTADNCTILAEQATNIADMDVAEVEKSVKHLEEDLKLADGDADKARIEKKLVIAKAKLMAVGGISQDH